ncbi:MAG TPA: hypothetical protein VD836_07300 [Solirubrobacteraceae bacterium]|nr:hypothetical protein [Solirubrobacteraceae bacterium]
MDAGAMLEEESARRRHIPLPVAVAGAVRAGRRAWDDDPEARAAARRAIFAVCGIEHDDLARAHLVEHAVREELIWRAWDAPLGRWTGAEHLDAAIASRRGVVCSFVHSGPFPGVTAAIASRTDRLHLVTGAWMFLPYEGDAESARTVRWLANLQALPVTLVGNAGSYGALADALRAGDAVLTAFDAPGSRPTPFLRQTIRLASGTARLAVETGALVVPIWRARERWRMRTVVGEPIEPGTDPDDLHERLARVHSAWILARPAALEDPTREGWWGDRITLPSAPPALDFRAAPT